MKKVTAIFLLLLAYGLAHAAEPAVLSAFFGHSGIKDKRSVYYGEMLEYYLDKPTLGEGLPRNVQATFRKLDGTQNRMVYAVVLSDGHKTRNWYAFLVRKKGIWKLSAVRTLALPGLFYMVLHQLEHKSTRSEKEEWEYQNMLLTIKSDSELKKYLKDNLPQFKKAVVLRSKGEKAQAEKIAKHLLIGFVKNDGGRIDFSIGGLLDNSVGYLYVPPGAKPPAMTPGEFIYVEKIVDRWYLYKTT